jgi:hypothetical protein
LVFRHIAGEDLLVIVVGNPGGRMVGVMVIVSMVLMLEHQPDRLQIHVPRCRTPRDGEQ